MLTPHCAQIKPLGLAVPMSGHPAGGLSVISGSDESLAPVVGLIDGILHRPVEPLSFRFLC